MATTGDGIQLDVEVIAVTEMETKNLKVEESAEDVVGDDDLMDPIEVETVEAKTMVVMVTVIMVDVAKAEADVGVVETARIRTGPQSFDLCR